MSDDDLARKQGAARKRPPDSPSRQLTDRVTFFEKVWTGSQVGNQQGGDEESAERAGDLGQRESSEETFERTLEEGDFATGTKTVKFEKITVKKTVREVAIKSRTPSEEKGVEDSAYQTESYGNGISASKSSSVTSLTGRFPSEDSLSRASPSKEDWDTTSNSSKFTTSSSEWYNEYRTQSFQQRHASRDYFRSKSEYDNHIASIRGQY